MNNKGQVLVIFVILLPIVFFILMFSINIGISYMDKKDTSDVIYMAVYYYLDNITDTDALINSKKIINKNIKDIEKIIIDENSDYIKITVLKKSKALDSLINNKFIEVSYTGFKNSKKIIKG